MSTIEMTPEWVSKMIDIILSRLAEMKYDNPNRPDLVWALGYYLAVSAEQNQKGN